MIESKGMKIVAMIVIVASIVFSFGHFNSLLFILSLAGIAGIVMSTLPRGRKMKWIFTPLAIWILIYVLDLVVD